MLLHTAAVRAALGLGGHGLWFGIQPVSAGVFGVAASAVMILVVSCAFPHRPPGTAHA
jgi:cation/acetate symporter